MKGSIETGDGLALFYTLLRAGAEAEISKRYGTGADAVMAPATELLAEKPAGAARFRLRPAGDDGVPATTIVEILNDDMPFLVDSVMAEIQTRDLAAHLVLHPIFKTERSADGRLVAIKGAGDRNWRDHQESFIQVHLDRLSKDAAHDLEGALSLILADVRAAVEDWQPMLTRVRVMIDAYKSQRLPIADTEAEEAIAFLEWLAAGSFTFLGLRELTLTGDHETGDLVAKGGSGLGILRHPEVRVLRRGRELANMTPEVRKFFFQPAPLIVSKASAIARVHRRVHLDYIGCKIFGEGGRIEGELRIVGLFTSTAYTHAVRNIPLLRLKAERVMAASGFPPDSHNGKALMNVLETFPRDELFQISPETLLRWSAAILDLELRPRVRVLSRVDEFDRFVSVLIYAPRDRYTTDVRQKSADYLAEIFKGKLAAFTPTFLEGPLVRTHYIIGRYEGVTPQISDDTLDEGVGRLVQTWQDRLAADIRQRPDGAALIDRFGAAFSAGYRDAFTPERALQDIGRIEPLSDAEPVAIDFYRVEGAPESEVRVALYRIDRPIPLSDRVPVFENLGFRVIDERSYQLSPVIGGFRRSVRLHDMVLEITDGTPFVLGSDDQRLETAFLAIGTGTAESDGYNRLIKAAGIDWRGAAAFRAYGAFLRQIRAPFSQGYIAETLVRHRAITADLSELFRLRFDPDIGLERADRDAEATAVQTRIETALQSVPSLDEDRIVRHFLNLTLATLRTNFFQRGSEGAAPAVIAFKLKSSAVDGMPDPKPFAEIWVTSPRVEGVHMRFSPIARGGLRWSDRAQDFRTEVLGLVKAQQVKNTVIVPNGAKGGFVPKKLPKDGGRDAVQKEGVAAYEIFVSSLLDITDNLAGNAIVPPERVVRYDGDDPYLVVAADKGTATFSDRANAISNRYGFWLGDAFASGGSAGYDHKKMGITARGGWECVKRHFREMDIDIQRTPFRVIGVGDMSGDVFGNAMLLSPAIHLVAAFDHRDIFIDPAPDVAASLTERQRMFQLPRSSWADYDAALISKGGAVFSRGAKSIALTPEIQSLLGVTAGQMTPPELMHAILKIPADLLWFGGIGTYVKASGESHEEAGDRANDAIRVSGAELRVKVIGEGANLALTQKGRIEFARHGGRLNTDFIDNSAGVNSSDQEVNIKIAFGAAIAAGKLDEAARNAKLVSMTDEVAAACLANNHAQSLALSLGESRSVADLGFQQRVMRELEEGKLLDRTLEVLPSDAQVAERLKAGEGLTRPELAVLLSYAKIDLSRKLMKSEVPDDPSFETLLINYFPEALARELRPEVLGHRLRREIIATVLTNTVINRGGSTFVVRLEEETGHGAPTIVAASAVADAIYGIDRLWHRVDALDSQVPGEIQLALYRELQDLLRRETSWVLRKIKLSEGLSTAILTYRAGADTVRAELSGVLAVSDKTRIAEKRDIFARAGVPVDLAGEVAALSTLAMATDVTLAAQKAGRPVEEMTRIYATVGETLRLSDLRAAADALQPSDAYDRLALTSTLSILSDAQRAIVENIARTGQGDRTSLEAWLDRHGQAAKRARAHLEDILGSGSLTLARLTIAAAQVRDLAAL